MKCGLLGRKLNYSYSPRIHSQFGNYTYVLFEKEPYELEDFLKTGDFHGCNVTVPYKKAVIPYLDGISPIARQTGAVNTIVRRKDGTLFGHNTDYYGFETLLRVAAPDVRGKKTLVLGSGGASGAVSAVLRDRGANVTIVSRSGENNYKNLNLHADACMIVNTTPVGMSPDTGDSPISLDFFPRLESVFDLIYNPTRTQLLMDAEKRGLKTQNGLLMLVAQAKESAEWFTGTRIPDAAVASVHAWLRRKTENIVLIGMPGSGKSVVGKMLSEKLGVKFVDADAYLSEKTGRAISEIFAADGEAAFRILETKVLSDLGKESGLVIATGGGCVTRAENYPLLHQNGTIFCLNRDTDKLVTDGRPLSQDADMAEMCRQRKPLYEQFADVQIDNNGDPEAAVSQILEMLP